MWLKIIGHRVCCLLLILPCFLLFGCWSSWSEWGLSNINVAGYSLSLDNSLRLERLQLNEEDSYEIVGLYQEIGNSDYKDSLLVAEKYSQWYWVNAFAQDNLDVLEAQWLTLSNINRIQLSKGEIKNWVIVEYEIIEWFIREVPILYVSQLFVPNWDNIVMFSFITEERSKRTSATKMFKNISK